MANQLFSNNPNTTTTPTYAAGGPPPPQATTYATKALTDSYLPSDSSVYATASRYLVRSSKLTAHSAFVASDPANSSFYNYHYTGAGTDRPISAAAFSRVRALAGHDAWSGVDAVSYQSLALKRSSEAIYHHNVPGARNTIGQNDWLPMSYLAKRPRVEESSILPIYPQRPGEKDCAHYMLTRTCKFGETCKFDHPIWVPEGGIPDWKEVPSVASDGLPERPGEPDCPYYLKTQKCKFGLNCKFNHPNEKEVALDVAGDPAALPERPSEPPCAFYLKTGICKFGATCRFHHPRHFQAPVLEQGKGTAVESFSARTGGSAGNLKSSILPTPAVLYNSKGLPIKPGELDCPFYLKTGSCKYGATCRFNHPDRIGQTLLSSPSAIFSIGVGNPIVSALQSFGQIASATATVVYPQRPGQIECDYYMKTGVCKFGERCRFHHPIDRAAPSKNAEKTVTLTLAGYPRREGAPSCPYYMKTSACKYGSTCKFDHPPPAEVLAMAAVQATSTATESGEEEGDRDPYRPSIVEPA